MILGLGIDLVEVARVAAVLKRYQRRFLARILTKRERERALSKANPCLYVAAYFAAKEACSKALGTGLRGISWQEMEVFHEASGKPGLKLYGRARERFLKLGGEKIHLSLSHERTHAIAVVIIEGNPPSKPDLPETKA